MAVPLFTRGKALQGKMRPLAACRAPCCFLAREGSPSHARRHCREYPHHHHGQVGVALHEAAALVDLYKPWSGQLLPATVNADALVVFGGEQAATDDHSHPYLPDLARLMAEYTAMDRPVLGICLGGQLSAWAFGAENRLGVAPEFGWVDVALTDAGRDDPVLSVLPQPFQIFQWHSDTFGLPEGAVHLATSPTAQHQAFRIGRAT